MTDSDLDTGNETGRALVREVLIRTLQAAGLKRARGQTEAAQAAAIDHLVGQLDHMTADNLRTLADVVIDHAAAPGPQQGHWPAEVLIIAWARGLQPRPFRLSRVVTSWLASVEGPKAEAGGWLVPLYRFLRRRQVPPTVYDMGTIQEQARADARQLAIVEDRIARGACGADDRDWHLAWLTDQQAARAIVDQGRGKRSTAGESTAGEAA